MPNGERRAMERNLPLAAGIGVLNVSANCGRMLNAALRARMIDSLYNAGSCAVMTCVF
jgi:hypothetical protein